MSWTGRSWRGRGLKETIATRGLGDAGAIPMSLNNYSRVYINPRPSLRGPGLEVTDKWRSLGAIESMARAWSQQGEQGTEDTKVIGLPRKDIIRALSSVNGAKPVKFLKNQSTLTDSNLLVN